MSYDIAIVGGGAAGFFCAISIKEKQPQAKIIILEKSDKLLSKVKISGGGRCNVTHNCTLTNQLILNYPRGYNQLESIFSYFSVKDTILWFEKYGVKLKTEPDGRMFPISNTSQTIIDCFLGLAHSYNIEIKTKTGVKKISNQKNKITLESENQLFEANKVVIATGGHPNESSYDWLKSLGIDIQPPVPSLFTFNDKSLIYKHLSGVSMPNAKISILESDFTQTGALLFTHWGLSGPAIIKLSAWAAEFLAAQNYVFSVEINFLGIHTCDQCIEDLLKFQLKNSKKNIQANPLFDVPKRLWETICMQSEISQQRSWAECGKKNIQKMAQLLTKNTLALNGKTTFKEEFVTCGGITFEQLNIQSLNLKSQPNIYFAGEILNIDGVTGGFNFQAAWSTAKVVADKIVNN